MKKKNTKWIITIFALTFLLSIIFSTISNVLSASLNDVCLFLILIIVIGLGIMFDMIGTASITADESTFHAMSSKKINGAKESISIIKNSTKISSVCNDVVGDVCGIISGALGAVLAISVSTNFSINNIVCSIVLSAFISSLTVGGKAICKDIAVKNSSDIVFLVGKLKHLFKIK